MLNSIIFETYKGGYGYESEDYEAVRRFLQRINREIPVTTNFLWGRWEWMHALPHMDKERTNTIGIWKLAEKIIGLATYEDDVGEVFLLFDPMVQAAYQLRKMMVQHVKENMRVHGDVPKIMIADTDASLQEIAKQAGFVATTKKQHVAAIAIDETEEVLLPEGFLLQTLAEECDLAKWNALLYRGFNNGQIPPQHDTILAERKRSIYTPNADLSLDTLVIAPNGTYAAFCGIWYEPGEQVALIEPVCTDPLYRQLGCGKAAVLSAIKRAGEKGAQYGYVGSAQPFYYKIGFAPVYSETFWEYEEK